MDMISPPVKLVRNQFDNNPSNLKYDPIKNKIGLCAITVNL